MHPNRLTLPCSSLSKYLMIQHVLGDACRMCLTCSGPCLTQCGSCAQVWLQQFAWTEAEKPGKLADRCEHVTNPASAASLDEEPMFCVETALKALYWSTLVYRYDENAPDFTRDKPLKVTNPHRSTAPFCTCLLHIRCGLSHRSATCEGALC